MQTTTETIADHELGLANDEGRAQRERRDTARSQLISSVRLGGEFGWLPTIDWWGLMIRSNLCSFWRPDVSLEICRGLDNQPSKSSNLQCYYIPSLVFCNGKDKSPFFFF